MLFQKSKLYERNLFSFFRNINCFTIPIYFSENIKILKWWKIPLEKILNNTRNISVVVKCIDLFLKNEDDLLSVYDYSLRESKIELLNYAISKDQRLFAFGMEDVAYDKKLYNYVVEKERKYALFYVTYFDLVRSTDSFGPCKYYS